MGQKPWNEKDYYSDIKVELLQVLLELNCVKQNISFL